MEPHLRLIGILLILLGLIHAVFPKYFNWKQEFTSVSTINREMMYVHAFFVGLVVCLMGLLCLMYPTELTNTSLGKKVSLGFGIFWIARLLIQFFFYSSTLWKGKTLETSIHILFSVLWTYFSLIFLLVFIEGNPQ